jgi:hypothetical protein
MLQHFVEGKWKENILDKYKIFFFINLNMTTASQGVCVANSKCLEYLYKTLISRKHVDYSMLGHTWYSDILE